MSDPTDATPFLRHVFYDMFGLNTALFKIVNADFGPLGDAIIQVANGIGDYEDAPFYFLAFFIAAFLHCHAWKRDTPRFEAVARRWRQFIICTAFALCCSGVAVYLLKIWLFMPRPFMSLPLGDIHIVGTLDKTVYTHTSFPSGHSSFAATLCASAWPFVRRNLRVLFIVLLLIAMWARVAAGLHFPVDVMAGAAIGIFAAVLARRTIAHHIP